VSFVLTITHEAAAAIDTVVQAGPDTLGTAGLRIGRAVTPEGQQGLELSVTDQPAPDDAVVDAEGTPVYLGSEVAEMLDDKVLDARREGDQVGFTLRTQDQPSA
jgi:Fe-S cluster assembly iron-binding protein IscA